MYDVDLMLDFQCLERMIKVFLYYKPTKEKWRTFDVFNVTTILYIFKIKIYQMYFEMSNTYLKSGFTYIKYGDGDAGAKISSTFKNYFRYFDKLTENKHEINFRVKTEFFS